MLQSIADRKFHAPALDGLRGFAILMVLVQHFYRALDVATPNPWMFPFVEGFLTTGGLGVQLFFLISAYTLFGSTRARWESDNSPRRNFYIRRAFRILPLWWVATCVYGIAKGRDLLQLLPNFLMYYGFLRHQPGVEVVYVQWSLFVEETFYLLLPLIFLFVKDARGALALFLGTFFCGYLWNQYAARLGVPTANNFIEMFPLSQWYCFGAGILLYLVAADKQVRARLFSARWAAAVDGAALILFVQMCREPAPYNTIAVAALFVAALHPTGWIGGLARSRLLGQFGIACYSIYLFHPLLIDGVVPRIAPLLGATLPFELVFISLLIPFAALNLALAAVTFRWIEVPSIRLGRALIRRLPAGRKDGAPTVKSPVGSGSPA